MTRPLRIAILTTGRFHVCDLARELSNLGHAVAFYSLVPPWRTKQFGLPGRCNRWLLPAVFPWFVLERLGRRHGGESIRTWVERRLIEAVDRTATRLVERCDVVVGMSGLFNRALAAAKRRFGSQIWIERGSRHIVSQKAILDAIPGVKPVSEFSVRRELTDYNQADTVTVLSRHCEQSFLDFGFPANRLVRNPVGVSLATFPPTPAPTGQPTIVMTGTWCLRKGCDVLTAAWRTLPGVRLLHVGPVEDCPLPEGDGFTHHAAVDQKDLPEYYARGHVFALASHEEGLALVQLQALSSGLRLVCTDRTGGEDLAAYTIRPNAVRVVPSGDPGALAVALRAALNDSEGDVGLRDLLGRGREELSWPAYGRRYEAALRERL